MAFQDLRAFIGALEAAGDLKRIAVEVDPILEITERVQRRIRAILLIAAKLFSMNRGVSASDADGATTSSPVLAGA